MLDHRRPSRFPAQHHHRLKSVLLCPFKLPYGEYRHYYGGLAVHIHSVLTARDVFPVNGNEVVPVRPTLLVPESQSVSWGKRGRGDRVRRC